MARIIARNGYKTVILGLASSLLLQGAPVFYAQATQDRDFSGDYIMTGKGFGPNDSAYSGTCNLKKSDQIYLVSCYNEDTKHTYTGKGLADGQTLTIFIGDYWNGDHGGQFIGEYLVLYQQQPDGSLTGTWVHAAGPAVGGETLTPKR